MNFSKLSIDDLIARADQNVTKISSYCRYQKILLWLQGANLVILISLFAIFRFSPWLFVILAFTLGGILSMISHYYTKKITELNAFGHSFAVLAKLKLYQSFMNQSDQIHVENPDARFEGSCCQL